MPAQITNDLQNILETRQPERVTVLIEGEPGAGGTIEDELDDLGVTYNRLAVQNKPIFEATILTDQLDQLQQSDNIVRIDFSGTFQPLSVTNSQQPGFATSEAPTAKRTSLYEVTEQLGVETAWEEAGTKGRGVKIGVIDTPIDARQESIRHAVADTEANTGEGLHGTWVSGALVARETETRRGRVRGIAPEADLYSYGALSGGVGSAAEIIEGIDWCIQQDVDIINLSLGGPHSEVLRSVVEEARAAGAVPVVSAGNSGPGEGTVTCPAHHDEALAVGSVNTDDILASFSSRGPGWTDAPLKPDVMAYGGSTIETDDGQQITESILGPAPRGVYAYLLGTSMAAPQSAGSLAIRLSKERINRGEIPSESE